MLKRLTEAQYRNSIADLFGEDIVLSGSLEPDSEVNGLYAVGSSVSTISAWGVERYEELAFDVAEQALADTSVRAALVPCTPTAVVDDACAATVLSALGRRAWRRPLTEAELDRLVGIAGTAASTLGSFDVGLTYGIAGLLQSTSFLYRVELGEDDPAGGRRYTSWEMATRLSFTLWNTTPDDALLDAAAAGTLVDDAGIAAEVDRMLADPRAREGVRNLFAEMFGLYALDELEKDPQVFVHMSQQVGPSAREETLLGVENLVMDEDGDYRDLYTTQTTFLDRKLAAIYNVPAPVAEGFGQTELPVSAGRRGLLGQASFLAAKAHPTSTSVTLRGKFVREVLLCQDVPPPPANENTAIPDVTEDARTMRDRLAIHLSDPFCAGCHSLTDYIGLGLENFDGLASYRTTDQDAPIDASGELDGERFANAWQLSGLIAGHGSLGPCLARTVYQYAQSRPIEAGDDESIAWHAQGFVDEGHRVAWLLRDVVLAPSFRKLGAS